MQLEGVGAVSVRRLLLQVLWQVDDHDGVERTFLQDKHYILCPDSSSLYIYAVQTLCASVT